MIEEKEPTVIIEQMFHKYLVHNYGEQVLDLLKEQKHQLICAYMGGIVDFLIELHKQENPVSFIETVSNDAVELAKKLKL